MTAKKHSKKTQPAPPDGRSRIDWDDLRIVLAVAATGSLAAGARQLGVNHTTVLRRIAAAEARLGLRLFDRRRSGYTLTAGGEELVGAARSIDDTVSAMERRLAGQDLRLSGTIRLTTTDTLMASILPRILAEFRAAHPGIVIETAVTNAIFNLTRREADVAIRPTAMPPDMLVGRRIGDVACAIYGAPSFAGLTGRAKLAAAPWLMPDDSLALTAISTWLRRSLPDASAVARADSYLTLRDLAAAGIGIAALPCYLGDVTPGLVRLGAPVLGMRTALWILTHEDLRRSARIRAFMEFAARAIAGQRPLLEGRARH